MLDAARKHVATLQRSFAATYSLLERPRVARRVLVFLLAIHSGLLAYSAYVHSPTLNEPGHLVAGLSYWKFGRFDVYNVNPPLVKMVAALPVMAVGYEEDWSGFYTGLGARPEFAMGEDFVAANGERSLFLFMIARWACIPFSWLGGIVCYLWARDLYGRPAGVIACAIWSFEPNILAHASLMTPDAHATSLGLAACYTFWRWLKHPTWTQTFVTGTVLGLTELAKTTFILFYPLWPLLWLAYRWSDRRRMYITNWLREAGMLATRMVVGLYVLNLGYGFEGSLKPLNEFQFVSDLFSRQASQSIKNDVSGEVASTTSHGVTHSPNRFAAAWIASLPVPFPQNYVVGIDIQQLDFENYGKPSYLGGEWRNQGWWYYYLYAVAIKTPLALLLLGVLALTSICLQSIRGGGWFIADDISLNGITCGNSFRDTFVLLAPAIIVFSAVSSKTGFSEHLRYVLPAFPFLFVLISGDLLTTPREELNCPFSHQRAALIPNFIFAKLVAYCWFIASSLAIYPHSLAYFNEVVGGPKNGRAHLLGSNIDWGQDLRYAKTAACNDSQLVGYSLNALYDPSKFIACGRNLISETGLQQQVLDKANSILLSVNDLTIPDAENSIVGYSRLEAKGLRALAAEAAEIRPLTYSIWCLRK